MTITRGKIKYEVLTRVNKTAASPGFYTDEKLNSAIQEALDFVGTEMFLADEGWMHKIDYITTVANQVTVPLRAHWAMIAEVRYLTGTVYMPLTYDQQWGESTWAPVSGVTSYPYRYRLVDNMIYFDPPIGIAGTNFLQVEYFAYPKILTKDTDFVDSQFDRSMYWFIVYDVCNTVSGQFSQTTDDWDRKENVWYSAMKNIISMRTRQVVPIKEYDG